MSKRGGCTWGEQAETMPERWDGAFVCVSCMCESDYKRAWLHRETRRKYGERERQEVLEHEGVTVLSLANWAKECANKHKKETPLFLTAANGEWKAGEKGNWLGGQGEHEEAMGRGKEDRQQGRWGEEEVGIRGSGGRGREGG